MANDRTITIRLVVDDQGSPRVRQVVQELAGELGKVTAAAGAAGQALTGMGSGAAGAEKGVNNLGAAVERLTTAPAKLAQGFRDLDGDIARALEQGSQSATKLTDSVQRTQTAVDRLTQSETRLADAHVRAWQGSNQAVSNLSSAVDKMLSGQRSAWDRSLSQILGVNASWDKAGQMARRAGDAMVQGAKSAWEGTKRLTSEISNLTGKVFNLRNAAVGLAAVWIFSHAVKPGLGFNETIESAQLGISSLLANTMELRDQTGKLLPLEARYAEAKRVSVQETDKLRIAGLATVATTEQLVEAYQQGVGPLTRAGVALGDVQKITVGIVQAAGALGMPMFQINEEVRSIAEGTINMHSRVAKTLGITNEMVASWKAQNRLAEELNKRLAAFAVAGAEAMDTWRGIKSNMADALGYLSGQATEPLFQALKAGWKGLLDQVFDIDLAAGKFDISAKFKPTIEALQRIFGGIGQVVEDALKAIPDKLAQATAWWERHGEAVKSIASNAYDAVKGIVEGSLSAAEKILSVLLPEPNRMASTTAGYQQVESSISKIVEHLKSVPVTTWQGLALAYLGGKTAGAPGAVVGLTAPKTLQDLGDIAQNRWPSDWGPWARNNPNLSGWLGMGWMKYLPGPDQQKRAARGDYVALPGWAQADQSDVWPSESDIGGLGYRGYSLSAGPRQRTSDQTKKLEDLVPWIEGKLADLQGMAADRAGDLVGKVQADRGKALAEIEKKLVDLRQAYLADSDEYKQVQALKDRYRREFDAKEIAAAAEANLKRVQGDYEMGQASRATLGQALEAKLAALRKAGAGETDEARQTAQAVRDLRLGGLKYDEEVLSKQVELHQASKADLVALYRAQAKEVEANEQLSLEAKTKLLLEYKGKIQTVNRSIVDDEEKVAEIRADLTRDTETKKLLELKRFDRQIADLGVKGLERDQLLALKREDLNKSSARRVLEDWADFGSNYEKLTQHTMESAYDAVEKSFENWLDGTATFGEALAESFRKIGIQAGSQFATALMLSLGAKGILALLPSSGDFLPFLKGWAGGGSGVQLGGGVQTGGFGLADVASWGKAAWNWLSGPSTASLTPAQATWLNGSGGWFGGASPAATSSIYAGGEWAGVNPKAWGYTPSMGWGATALTGLGGGVAGWMMNQGKGTTAQIVGAGAGAAGSIGGSMLATALLSATPLAPVAPILGALLGGGAGGMLGGLFGQEPNDAPQHYASNLQRISSGSHDALTLNDLYHQYSKGAGSLEEIAATFKSMMAAGTAAWWQQDPEKALKQGNLGDQGYWRVAGLGGSWGDQGLADLGSDRIKDLSAAVAEAEDALGPFDWALRGALEGIDLSNTSAADLAATLTERLTPAMGIQAQLQAQLAGGADLLTAHQGALNNTIQGLLYTQDLSATNQQQMIDLLLSESGTVEDLLAKKSRLDEITKQLASANQLGADKTHALVVEGRELAKELGLQKETFGDTTKAVDKLVDAVQALIDRLNGVPSSKSIAINYTDGGGGDGYHGGGLVMHGGGWVAEALRRGLITESGGSLGLTRLHGGDFHPDLKYDEVQAILRRREFVVREEAVNGDTLPGLRELNRTGRLPQVPLPVMVPVAAPAAALVINLAVHLTVQGDVIGDAGALAQLQAAAEAGAQRGVMAALAAQAKAGESQQGQTGRLRAPI